jgi:hypothetical protein
MGHNPFSREMGYVPNFPVHSHSWAAATNAGADVLVLAVLIHVPYGFHRGDLGHNLVHDLLADFLDSRSRRARRLLAQVLEQHRAAILYNHPIGPRNKGAAAVSFVGAPDPDGHNRSRRLDDDQSETGVSPLEPAVETAGTFRKDEHGVSCLKTVKDGFQARHRPRVRIDRHDVPEAEKTAESREAEQGFARQHDHGPRQAGADQRRVDETDVVGGQDHRSLLRHPPGIEDPPAEIDGEDSPEKTPARSIPETHPNGCHLRLYAID